MKCIKNKINENYFFVNAFNFVFLLIICPQSNKYFHFNKKKIMCLGNNIVKLN